MDFVDIILFLLYLSSMVAAGAVVWSITKHFHTDKESQKSQKGDSRNKPTPFKVLTSAVFCSLVVLFVATALLFKGDLASIMMTTLFITMVIAMLTVAWAAVRRK